MRISPSLEITRCKMFFYPFMWKISKLTFTQIVLKLLEQCFIYNWFSFSWFEIPILIFLYLFRFKTMSFWTIICRIDQIGLLVWALSLSKPTMGFPEPKKMRFGKLLHVCYMSVSSFSVKLLKQVLSTWRGVGFKF